ncbi:MAG: DUF177 domain-containing protein [Telmatospirillum sp.]|nr:DUF177 domain-containing protein [Telmatospirillum sp.]
MITPEFARPVAVERLGHDERSYDIEASQSECQALADRFSILAVTSLSATVRLRRMAGGNLIRVAGRFVADVEQACVVTLEPVPAHIEDSFELTYSTELPRAAARAGEETEIVVDMDAEDPPEPVEDGQIDIGEVTAEHLALALDPFPRAAGAVFETPSEPPEPVAGARENPFDVLARLKKT